MTRLAVIACLLLVACATRREGSRLQAPGSSQMEEPEVVVPVVEAADDEVGARVETAVGALAPVEQVDVKVERGVVTLRGWVADLPAREQLEQAAEQVEGVRLVRNHLEVRAARRPDVEVAREVAAALGRVVTVEDGVVMLAGEVGSLAERRELETIAKNVSGVVAVDNRLEVGDAVAAAVTDAGIAEAVLAALRADGRVDASLLDVAVDDRMVFVSGTVRTPHERRIVEELASVPGARKVNVSGLEIRPTAPPAE